MFEVSAYNLTIGIIVIHNEQSLLLDVTRNQSGLLPTVQLLLKDNRKPEGRAFTHLALISSAYNLERALG